MIACPQCGFEAPDDFAFCPKCATALGPACAIPEERKAVIMLAAAREIFARLGARPALAETEQLISTLGPEESQ